MKGWLQKILTPPAAQKPAGGKAPAQRRAGSLPAKPLKPGGPQPAVGLPNATVIYGVGASLMFVASFFLLIKGRWLPALVVLAIGACLVGFALHLLKHQD